MYEQITHTAKKDSPEGGDGQAVRGDLRLDPESGTASGDQECSHRQRCVANVANLTDKI